MTNFKMESGNRTHIFKSVTVTGTREHNEKLD
jgi:hypothetical protein